MQHIQVIELLLYIAILMSAEKPGNFYETGFLMLCTVSIAHCTIAILFEFPHVETVQYGFYKMFAIVKARHYHA